MTDQLLTAKDLAEVLGISPNAVYTRLYRGGDLPPPIQVGARALRWCPKDVERWKDGARYNPYTQPRPGRPRGR